MPICAAPARFEHHAVAQQEMGAEEVKAFLSHLATQMNVAASTQNQAFSALLFLAQDVLKKTAVAAPRAHPLSRKTCMQSERGIITLPAKREAFRGIDSIAGDDRFTCESLPSPSPSSRGGGGWS